MKKVRMLDEADLKRLASLIDPEAHPRLNKEQHSAVSAMLAETAVTRDPSERECRIGLSDRITLVSPEDPGDWYKPEIVPPEEEDIDADKISAATPVGCAVLGKRVGERVSWSTPVGERVMVISAVEKQTLPA